MKPIRLPAARVRRLLAAARKTRILVVGDLMLDRFIWGRVVRISPEAPVPVVEFERESLMPGGAANAARNLISLGVQADLCGVVGADEAGGQMKRLLADHRIRCEGVQTDRSRPTSVKTRIVAQRHQVVRLDRESRDNISSRLTKRLVRAVEAALPEIDAVIICDYGKGVVTQPLLNAIKPLCRESGRWLSLDPKPVHEIDLAGISLVTPNRKEVFELARLTDETRHENPLLDPNLMAAAKRVLEELNPVHLLVTLGEQGMLLCRHLEPPFHIPTVAREVFDVSGAGDAVIAAFTLAVASGASPVEAAILANHVAGVVVGKVGTATAGADEVLRSFNSR